MKDWIDRKLQELKGPAKIIPFPLKDENIERQRQAHQGGVWNISRYKGYLTKNSPHEELDENSEIEGYDEYIETS